MAESTVILAAICGALLACAPVFVVSGRRNAPLRLSDALAGLSELWTSGRRRRSRRGGRTVGAVGNASSNPLAADGERAISSHPHIAGENSW